MKRKLSLKKQIALAMAVVLCMLCFLPVRANAAAANYKSVYKKLLQKSKISYTDSYNIARTEKPSYFALLDIDKNGVPELFVSSLKPDNAFLSTVIFSVKNGKAVFCGEYYHKGDSYIHYSKKHKALYDYYWINGVGGAGERLCRLSKYKLKEYKHLYAENKSAFSDVRIYKYASNGADLKTVSAAKSTSLYNKYFKETRQKYTLKKNTAANRKKLLG